MIAVPPAAAPGQAEHAEVLRLRAALEDIRRYCREVNDGTVERKDGRLNAAVQLVALRAEQALAG